MASENSNYKNVTKQLANAKHSVSLKGRKTYRNVLESTALAQHCAVTNQTVSTSTFYIYKKKLHINLKHTHKHTNKLQQSVN